MRAPCQTPCTVSWPSLGASSRGQRYAITLPLIAAVLGVITPQRTNAQTWELDDELIVRTYDPSGLLTGRVVAARQPADEILRHAGVSVRWRHCDFPDWVGSTNERVCDRRVGANDVVIRIAAAPATAAARTLGFTYIDHSADRSWLATIFADRLTEMANRVGVKPELLIGRAIAHEVGHLLLETATHTRRGFMRAVWSDAMLTRSSPGDWWFAPEEAALVRRNVSARVRRSVPGVLARGADRPTDTAIPDGLAGR